MPIDPSLSLKAYNAADWDKQRNDNQLAAQRQQAAEFDQQLQPLRVQQAQQQVTAGQLEQHKSQLDIQAQLLGSATDQATYDAARAKAQQFGLDVSQAPTAYDPAWVKQMQQATLTAAQRIQLQQQELENNRWNQQFNETQRHNRVAERVDLQNAATSAQNADTKLQLAGSQAELAAEKAKNLANPPKKPLPTKITSDQSDAIKSVGVLNDINNQYQKYIDQIDKGTLDFGPISNKINEGLNYAGQATENSTNYANFRRDIQQAVNESLRLNKGVQTEGDAIRESLAILSSSNDPQAIKSSLQRLQDINKRNNRLSGDSINAARSQYGYDPIDLENPNGTAPNPSASTKPAAATPTDAQKPILEKLKAGTITRAQAKAQLEALK